MKGAAARAFWSHGNMCATRPCEVLFSIITLTITMVSYIDWQKNSSPRNLHPDFHGIDVLFMMTVRCGALLYTYHQFQNLSHHGSKYLFGIAALMVVFSSLIFCCTVLKLLDCNVSDLKDAVFFFLLLIDLSKAKYLAQFALESSSYKEVQENIAEGLSLLGPSLTLDTIAEALLIGAGSLSGISRVEQMCAFAVLSIIVNYIILMTFYPSCLSLILEFSHRCSSSELPWQWTKDINKTEDTKSNPILQGVKIIMSAGLFLVHGITRWSFNPETQFISAVIEGESRNSSSEPPIIVRWLNAGLDHAVVMLILFVLVIKYTFFETWPMGEISQIMNKEKRTPSPSQMTSTSSSSSSSSSSKNEKLVSSFLEGRMIKCDSDGTGNDLQTENGASENEGDDNADETANIVRSLEECRKISEMKGGFSLLKDCEVLQLVIHNCLSQRSLEKKLEDSLRAVSIRRSLVSSKLFNKGALKDLPFKNYDYQKVQGNCCENVIGYVPVPVGVAGPLKVNGIEYMIPLATTEGALVASTSRGCKAVSESGPGVTSRIVRDGITRAPVIQLPTTERAVQVSDWIKNEDKFAILKKSFDATSNFARLKSIHVAIAARFLFIRFEAKTGDAMGMNMVTKGTEAALRSLKEVFPDIEVISISGNVCTDKKPSAINWILGRGKSVVCEAVVPATIVSSVLKTSVNKLVENNLKKNFIGSSLAGSIGGNNAHAANIIAALFIACGQDPAQVVEGSSCLTWMERWGPLEEDLFISVTMPCIEVGTVGGGTALPPQASCLNMLGIKGPSKDASGEHADRLAMIAAAAVMAGELSLMASLTEQTLLQSHLSLNRRTAPTSSPVATPTSVTTLPLSSTLIPGPAAIGLP